MESQLYKIFDLIAFLIKCWTTLSLKINDQRLNRILSEDPCQDQLIFYNGCPSKLFQVMSVPLVHQINIDNIRCSVWCRWFWVYN